MITTTIKGISLNLKTRAGLFSPRTVDNGTLAMLSVIEFEKDDKICDLGCGYGVVGLLAAKLVRPENVVMVDNDEQAIETAKENAAANEVSGVHIAHSDGFSGIRHNDFTKIICHPPYHADFAVPKMFIEKGFNRLALEGRMYMVTKRKEWYRNKLISIFGGVKVWEIEDYFVYMAIKKSDRYSNSKGNRGLRKI